MIMANAVQAQTVQYKTIDWKIGGHLPSTANNAPHLGVAGPLAGFYNNVFLIGGGANFPDAPPWLGGKKKYHNTGYVYTIDTVGNVLFTGNTFTLPQPVAYGAVCPTSHGIFMAGGENEEGALDKAYLFAWDKKSMALTVATLPPLPIKTTNAAAVAHGDWVFVAGGENAVQTSDAFYALQLTNLQQGWVALPSLPQPTSHAVMCLQANGVSDCIYVLGGRRKNQGKQSTLYAEVFQYDIAHKKWTVKKKLPHAVSAGTGVAVGASNIMLIGGDQGKVFNHVERLLLETAHAQHPAQKEKLIQQRISLQTNHPGFLNEVWVYNTLTDRWVLAGSVPFVTPVTTTAVKVGAKFVVIPSGEIKAGVRTPQILVAELF